MTSIAARFANEISTRLRAIDALAVSGGLDAAVDILSTSLQNDGVLQAFGTGHSAAFAMEIVDRAGGLVPTHRLSLDDLVLYGGWPLDSLGTPEMERTHTVADELWDLYDIRPNDVLLVASNSGANGSTVGLALRAKAEGIPIIAVTSLDHSSKVEPKHPGGQRLYEVADVVIDNLAPLGDTTIDLADGVSVGAVSSITAAYIAQLLTLGVVERLRANGQLPPIYVSANVPAGDLHNSAFEARYAARVRAGAHRRPTRAPGGDGVA